MSTNPNIPPCLVILGSARRHSDTRKFAEFTFARKPHSLIDLCDYIIEEYDYEAEYSEADQFNEVMELILQHEIVVFATPVYWYAMSGKLKNLFDRFTDSITVEKDKGRQLRGKKIAMIAIGNDLELPKGFETPFSRTAEYLGMEYIDGVYYSSTLHLDSSPAIAAKADFIRKLEGATTIS